MRFVQYYLDCLSQASYLIGDETTGRAVVVDPRRDVQQYLDDAAGWGLSIDYVIETHFHADFLSGHLELADATGATIVFGAGAEAHFPHREVADGERASLGEVVLEFRATPGHTPESISVVVWERPADAAPYGVLTGDTLFIGDVGRPDLATATVSADDLARQLYASVHTKLLVLPDATRVFPAHGAGSACGKNLSTAKTSTIGEQRRTNYALQPMSADEFVALVTEGQTRPPDYFAYDAVLNREPHELLDERPPPALTLDEVLARVAAGATVLDTRSAEAFGRGHLRRSVNVGLEGRFAEYAGTVVDPTDEIVLVAEAGTETEAKMRLGRIGFDRVSGALERATSAFATAPTHVQVASRLTVDQLAQRLTEVADLQVLDVRSAGERALGGINRSAHIPLPDLRPRVDELDPVRPIVVYCAGGYRSSIAASLLRASGFSDVSDLLGGYGAWMACEATRRQARESGLMVHRAEPLNCETSIGALIGGTVMPNARFYVRNHFETPELDPATWRLEVSGAVDRPLHLSLGDLRRMPSASAVVTLECAGNGRSLLDPPVPGEPWGLGAVSTAEWTGVPVAEVLERADLRRGAVDVLFRGADRGGVEGRADPVHFERSLTIDEAMAPGVLLAYAMNGEPLPLQHGFPLRVVVPRWYAVASVKWLAAIDVLERPFHGYFQGEKYVFEWPTGREPVGHKRVRALITEPAEGTTVDAGELAVRGVAWSGAAPIARVEVCIDGAPWRDARLLGTGDDRAWQWWELLTTAARSGPVVVRARATDAAGRVQPDAAEWNALGYGANPVHAVAFSVAEGSA